MIRNLFRGAGDRAKESVIQHNDRQHAIIVRREFAEEAARKIEAVLPIPCTHQNRKSCPVCAERRTIQAAAAIVREAGGVQP